LLPGTAGHLSKEVAFGLDPGQALGQGFGVCPMAALYFLEPGARLGGLVPGRLKFLVMAGDPFGHPGELLAIEVLLVLQRLAFLFKLADAGLQRAALGLQPPGQLNYLPDALRQGIEVLEHGFKPLEG
jgi:hypothetical protein